MAVTVQVVYDDIEVNAEDDVDEDDVAAAAAAAAAAVVAAKGAAGKPRRPRRVRVVDSHDDVEVEEEDEVVSRTVTVSVSSCSGAGSAATTGGSGNPLLARPAVRVVDSFEDVETPEDIEAPEDVVEAPEAPLAPQAPGAAREAALPLAPVAEAGAVGAPEPAHEAAVVAPPAASTSQPGAAGAAGGAGRAAYRAGALRTWLCARRCETGTTPTHTSIAHPKGRFHVPPEDEAEFYHLYLEAMRAREDLHLTEKPHPWSPVRIDLDLRFQAPPPPSITPDANEDRPPPARAYVRDDHIRRIVLVISRVLARYLDLPPASLRAFVMEKPSPVLEVRTNLIRDGVHLLYPRVVTETPFQFFVREKLLQVLPDILSPLNPSNGWADIVDEKIIELNNWQLYGSCKPGYSTYATTAVYDYSREADDLSELPVPALDGDMMRLMAVRGRGATDGAPFSGGAEGAEVADWVKRVYPSIAGRKRNALNQQVFAPTVNRSRNVVTDEELNTVRRLTLQCLTTERAETYDTWVRVGWALRNIDHRLLDTWVAFSRMSSKFVEGDCEKKWSKMRMDGTLGIGSLRFWARHDKPDVYKSIMDDSLQILLDRCASNGGNGHFDIALVVHNVFKDQLVSLGRSRWFFFDQPNHRWACNNEGQMIRYRLSVDICTRFMERARYLTNRHSMAAPDVAAATMAAGVTPDERLMAADDTIIKTLLKISEKLRQSSFKASVLKECEVVMFDEHFEDKLDSKPHLLGFKNGVYDLSLREFRDGQPDDYISFSTGINYVPYDPNSTVAAEIHGFFATVHRNPAVRKYQWDILASSLDGAAKSEKFYIMTGNGSNGANYVLFDCYRDVLDREELRQTLGRGEQTAR